MLTDEQKQNIKDRIQNFQKQREDNSKIVLMLDGAIQALVEILNDDAKKTVPEETKKAPAKKAA